MATDGKGIMTEADGATPLGLIGVLNILKRWAWLVAPLIALSLVLAFVATSNIKPEYTARATVLLVGPNETFVDDTDTGSVSVEAINPLQSLGGSLTTVARVVVLSLTSPTVSEQLAEEGLSPSVGIGLESRSPIVWVEARHFDRATATSTANRMVELLFEDLDARQDQLDAPETDRITGQLISAGTAGGADYGARTRVRLGLIAVGLLVSCGAAFLLEVLSQHRARNDLPSPDFYGELSPAAPQIPATSRQTETFFDWAESATRGLVATLQLLTGRRDTAEQLSRQAVGAAAERWERVSRTEPEIWLYREALSYLPDLPDGKTDDQLASDPLWSSLQDLDSQSQQAVAMTAVSQLSHDDIAKILELKPRRLNAILTHASLPSNLSDRGDRLEVVPDLVDVVGDPGAGTPPKAEPREQGPMQAKPAEPAKVAESAKARPAQSAKVAESAKARPAEPAKVAESAKASESAPTIEVVVPGASKPDSAGARRRPTAPSGSAGSNAAPSKKRTASSSQPSPKKSRGSDTSRSAPTSGQTNKSGTAANRPTERSAKKSAKARTTSKSNRGAATGRQQTSTKSSRPKAEADATTAPDPKPKTTRSTSGRNGTTPVKSTKGATGARSNSKGRSRSQGASTKAGEAADRAKQVGD